MFKELLISGNSVVSNRYSIIVFISKKRRTRNKLCFNEKKIIQNYFCINKNQNLLLQHELTYNLTAKKSI